MKIRAKRINLEKMNREGGAHVRSNSFVIYASIQMFGVSKIFLKGIFHSKTFFFSIIQK